MQTRCSVFLLEQAVDEGAGVLVVDDRDHELHEREYRRANHRQITANLDRLFD